VLTKAQLSIRGKVAGFGDFRFDLSERRLFAGTDEIALNPKASEVLAYLLQHPRTIVSRDELMSAIWSGVAVTDDALVQRVLDIRKALGDDSKNPRYIRTHPRRGYEWIANGIADADQAGPDPAKVPVRAGWVWGAALIVTLAGGVWWLSRDPATSRDYVAARLTSQSGMEDYPSADPTGSGRIVFSANEPGAANLWILNPTGGPWRRFTEGKHHDSAPDWSPDGQWIAFRSEREGGGIFAQSMDGRVLRVAEFGHHPRWSPDGRRIAFHTEGGDGKLFVWERTSGAVSEVQVRTPPIRNRAYPAWGPRGESLLFLGIVTPPNQVAGGVALGHQIWSIRIGASQATLVSRGIGLVRDGGFDLSRDGSEAVYVGLDRGLWKLPLTRDGGQVKGKPVRLTLTTEEHQHPRYDGAGGILFSTVASPDGLWLIPFGSQGVPEESRMTRLTRDGVLARHAAVSPDGRRVAYITWAGDRFEIWGLEMGSKRSWRMSPPGGGSRTRPLWAANGRALLYQQVDGNSRKEVLGWLDERGETVARETGTSFSGTLRNGRFGVDPSGKVELASGATALLSADELARIGEGPPAEWHRAANGVDV
jgi:DNA-binding winged helix-turn-helix (wHTH) protein